MAANKPPFDAASVLSQVPAQLAFSLFDHLPDTYLFVKDSSHRFVAVNTALWRLHGCHNADEMLGRSDLDFQSPALGLQYIAEDREVMTNKQPVIDRLWLVSGADGLPLWYRSTKVPLRDTTGNIIGIAGVMRPASQSADEKTEYARLQPALDYVMKNYAKPVTVKDLARRCDLSTSQLQREFQHLLHLTPSTYIQKVRVLMARHLLERTTKSVGDIALATGFYDQSHFTRVFSQHAGMAPLAYRKRFGV